MPLRGAKIHSFWPGRTLVSASRKCSGPRRRVAPTVPASWPALLQVAADDLNHVVGGFFGGFGVMRHVVADVILHKFAHQAVDGATRGGQALQSFGAGFVGIQCAEHAFELADHFLGAVEQVQFAFRNFRHNPLLPYWGRLLRLTSIYKVY